MPQETKYQVTPVIDGVIVGVHSLQDRGRVQVPKAVRQKLRIKDGDKVYWVEGTDGRIHLVKATKV